MKYSVVQTRTMEVEAVSLEAAVVLAVAHLADPSYKGDGKPNRVTAPIATTDLRVEETY